MADNLIDELERLSGLHRSGALTDAEFDAAKRLVLGSAGAPSTEAPGAAPGAPPPARSPEVAWVRAPEREDAPPSRVVDLSLEAPARTVASVAERDALLLETLDNEPIVPLTELRPPLTSTNTISIVVALVAVAAVVLLLVALVTGGGDDDGIRPLAAGDDPALGDALDAGAIFDGNPTEDLLTAGGEIHVAPIDLPGDSWETGTVVASALPTCPALGDVDPDRVQLLVDHGSGLAISIVPTSGATTGDEFGPAFAECIDIPVTDEGLPSSDVALAAGVFTTGEEPTEIDIATYVLPGPGSEQWIVSLMGDPASVEQEGPGSLRVVEDLLLTP